VVALKSQLRREAVIEDAISGGTAIFEMFFLSMFGT
jgi:hypothetical protein